MWILIILIGEVTKLFMLKKQKYFTPIRFIGMLLILVGIALRQISSSPTQFTIIGGMLIAGLLIYVIGWDRKRIAKGNDTNKPDAPEHDLPSS